MERKSLLAGTPQEVIITICKGELRAGGAERGGHPISLLWHKDETLHHTTRLHVACTYAEMQGDERAHTHRRRLSLGLRLLQRISWREASTWMLLYDALLFDSAFFDCYKIFTGRFVEWVKYQPLWDGQKWGKQSNDKNRNRAKRMEKQSKMTERWW